MDKDEIDQKVSAACACLTKARELLCDVTLEDISEHSLEGINDAYNSMGDDKDFLRSLLSERHHFDVLLEPLDDDPDAQVEVGGSDDDDDDDDEKEGEEEDDEDDDDEESGGEAPTTEVPDDNKTN